eukprot:gene4785-5035_t
MASTEPAAAARILSVVPGMLSTAHELRLDVQLLSQHNKQLLGCAKKLCGSFRAAGRAIRFSIIWRHKSGSSRIAGQIEADATARKTSGRELNITPD